MSYRTLGKTGVKISPLTLGAMNFGARATGDHDEAVRIIHRALDSGINIVDTTEVYSQGESEVIVGKALKGRRDDVFVATKFDGQFETDFVDLYQQHKPDPDVDLSETIGDSTIWCGRDLEPTGGRLFFRLTHRGNCCAAVGAGGAATGTARSQPADRSDQTRDHLALGDLARQTGLTLPELSVAFVLSHSDVDSVIIGPRTFEQLESLLGAPEIALARLHRADEGWLPPWLTTDSAARRRGHPGATALQGAGGSIQPRASKLSRFAVNGGSPG